MGVVLGSAVVPIAICISWKKANKWGCIGGAIAGFCCGLIAWLVCTSTRHNGVLNVTVSLRFTRISCRSRTDIALARLLEVWRALMIFSRPSANVTEPR